MAKNKDQRENLQEENDSISTVSEPMSETVSEIWTQVSAEYVIPQAPMPVEKQEAAHASVNLKAALQPGRPFLAEKNVMGEIDQLIHDSEISGKNKLVGELHVLKVKVGDLLSHLKSLEQNADAHVKQLYTKMISFFRK